MSNLLLIDLSSIGHAMWHVCANEPDPNAASTKTIERVRALASGQLHVAIALDTPPYFRSDISADYKATRAKDNNAVISHQLALAADVLRADGFPVWGAKGYEADDIIATAVYASRRERAAGHDSTVTIASADKDILQLVSERVSVKSLKDGSIIGPDEVKAKLGCWPHQVVDYLSLVGDASDNIKGAEKIGPKRAATLLELFGNLPDAIKAAQAGMGDDLESKSLRDFAPRAETVRQLITLRTDAPIAFEEIFKERVPQDVAVFAGDEVMDASREVLPDAAPAGTVAPADRPKPQSEPTAVVREARTPDVQRDGPDAARAESDQGRPTVESGPTVQEFMNIAEAHAANQAARKAAQLIPREPDIISAAPVEWKHALEPRSYEQAKQAAADMFAARMFSQWGNAPAVLAIILSGREFGMPMMASLRGFDNIDGKPAMKADLIRGLVLRSGKVEYFDVTERTDTRATFVIKRNGRPEVSMSYTIEEAKKAWKKGDKAWENSNYVSGPADMLVARCSAKLGRLVCPDVTHGLYSTEELS